MLLTDILLIILTMAIIILLASLPSLIRKAVGEKVEFGVYAGPRRYIRNHTEAQLAPRELLVEAYAPLPKRRGHIDFRDVKRGWLRIKVKDINDISKKITGLDLKNVKMIVIEPEEKAGGKKED